MVLLPPGIMLDNNQLVATGMAICKSLMKPVILPLFTLNPLVTVCKLDIPVTRTIHLDTTAIIF
jgi:hypothetical protein